MDFAILQSGFNLSEFCEGISPLGYWQKVWCSWTGTLQDKTAEAWCSRKGTLQARAAEAWCSRTGTLQAQIPSTASDGLAPSAFDPSLEYSTDNVVLVWQTRPIFRSGRLRRLSSTTCHILARRVYDVRIGQAL